MAPRPGVFRLLLGFYTLFMIFLGVMWYTTVYGKPKPPEPLPREIRIVLPDAVIPSPTTQPGTTAP